MFGSNLAIEPRWLSSKVQHYSGSVAEMSQHIPRFERASFSGNEYLDVIKRIPVNANEESVSVGVVSKQYQLVQHMDIFDRTIKAMEKTKMDISKSKINLSMSNYGERMALTIELPDMAIDPGDGHDLALQFWCFNSVDGSSRLRLLLGWFRLVCSNGMVIGSVDTDYRKRHKVKELQLADVDATIDRTASIYQNDIGIFKRWINIPVTTDKLAQWVDGPVVKKWGVKAAARVYHIATEGRDAKIIPFAPKAPPSEKDIELGELVPGSETPATNKFAASQVLTWLASQRNDIEDQLQWQSDIPNLMRSLTK